MASSASILPSELRRRAYRGYETHYDAHADEELTQVGPGTPAGEYLRRYWHPIALASEVGELPVALRILGEDLVLFRDGSNHLGLVHRRCPHRQASLEFASCETHGIRCCYHGWHFDVDGTLLEAPGQPAEAQRRLRQRVRLGAYPVFEYQGLVFAYMGPARGPTGEVSEFPIPEFPVYDTVVLEEMERVPYKARFQCNWLQVLDAILDPIHTSFLHSSIGRAQFSEGFGEVGQMDFFERDAWLLGCNTRRVGDNVWLRINELVLPNFTQAGAAFATDGTAVRYYGRSAFSRWVVPVDDEHTLAVAWANFGPRGDPPAWNTPEGPELIEQGEIFDRSYEQRQRYPGDAEAVEGMGPVTVHANEHLAPSDKGVALMRRRLRAEVRRVAEGAPALQVPDLIANPVPTYGGDSVLRLPRNGCVDESSFLSELAHAFVERQFQADGLTEEKRMDLVSQWLRDVESRGGL